MLPNLILILTLAEAEPCLSWVCYYYNQIRRAKNTTIHISDYTLLEMDTRFNEDRNGRWRIDREEAWERLEFRPVDDISSIPFSLYRNPWTCLSDGQAILKWWEMAGGIL